MNGAYPPMMPAPLPMAAKRFNVTFMLMGAMLFFILGTYAQIASGFILDVRLAAIAWALVNAIGLIVFFTVFRLPYVPAATFVLSMAFAGMAAAAAAVGAT